MYPITLIIVCVCLYKCLTLQGDVGIVRVQEYRGIHCGCQGQQLCLAALCILMWVSLSWQETHVMNGCTLTPIGCVMACKGCVDVV